TTRGIALWNGVEIAGALPDGFNPSPFTNGSDWDTGIAIHGDFVWSSTQPGLYRSQVSLGLTQTPETIITGVHSIQNIAADDTTLIAVINDTPFVRSLDPGGSWAFANRLAGGGLLPGAVRVSSDYGKVLLTA